MDQEFLNKLMKYEKFGKLYEVMLENESLESIAEMLRFTGMIFDLIDIRLQSYAKMTNAIVAPGVPDDGVLSHIKRICRQHIINRLENDDEGKKDEEGEKDEE